MSANAEEGQRLVVLGNRLSIDGCNGLHCGDPLNVLIAPAGGSPHRVQPGR